MVFATFDLMKQIKGLGVVVLCVGIICLIASLGIDPATFSLRQSVLGNQEFNFLININNKICYVIVSCFVILIGAILLALNAIFDIYLGKK